MANNELLIIRGMKLPKGCSTCRFKAYSYNDCIAAGKRLSPYASTIDDYKPTWCPLIALNVMYHDGCRPEIRQAERNERK